MTKPIPGFTAEMRDACAEICEPYHIEPRYPETVSEAIEFGEWHALFNAQEAIRAMPVCEPFPEPMREPRNHGNVYWVVMLDLPDYCAKRNFSLSDGLNVRWFARGLCHDTREDAVAHARYLLSLSTRREAVP